MQNGKEWKERLCTTNTDIIAEKKSEGIEKKQEGRYSERQERRKHEERAILKVRSHEGESRKQQ